MCCAFFSCTDGFITRDADLLNFIPKLAHIVKEESQCVYVHCWGGHGRTGTVIALLLAYLYNLGAERALHLTQLFHSQRVNRKSRSPQTGAQVCQVRRLVKQLQDKEEEVEEEEEKEEEKREEEEEKGEEEEEASEQ